MRIVHSRSRPIICGKEEKKKQGDCGAAYCDSSLLQAQECLCVCWWQKTVRNWFCHTNVLFIGCGELLASGEVVGGVVFGTLSRSSIKLTCFRSGSGKLACFITLRSASNINTDSFSPVPGQNHLVQQLPAKGWQPLELSGLAMAVTLLC